MFLWSWGVFGAADGWHGWMFSYQLVTFSLAFTKETQIKVLGSFSPRIALFFYGIKFSLVVTEKNGENTGKHRLKRGVWPIVRCGSNGVTS
jgi:hypothetical protein